MKIKLGSIVCKEVVFDIGVLLNFVAFFVFDCRLVNIAEAINKKKLSEFGCAISFFVGNKYFIDWN